MAYVLPISPIPSAMLRDAWRTCSNAPLLTMGVLAFVSRGKVLT
jgi:hypothetical protein